jgi:hypothetical protein
MKKILCKIFGHLWEMQRYESAFGKARWIIKEEWLSPWRKRTVYHCERCGYTKYGESKFIPE